MRKTEIEEMMEQTRTEYMKEKFAFFGGMSLLYGLLYTLFFYQSKMGINNILWVLSIIVIGSFLLKKTGIPKKKRTNIYLVWMLLLGISSALTTSMFFYVCNTIGILCLYVLFMIHQFYDKKVGGSLTYVKGFFVIAGNMFLSTFKPYSHTIAYFSGNTTARKKKWTAGLIGVLLGIGILAVILPFLLNSDAVFSQMVGRLLKYVNIWDGIQIVFSVLFGFHICYTFFFSLCKNSEIRGKETYRKKGNPVIGITSLTVIGIIYLLYVAIQITYLFLGIEKGLPQGMTYAQYARGGFWELLFVSTVNLFLVIIWSRFFEKHKVLSVLLALISGCTFVMILSAGYRMLLYIQVYHLTFLRLFVMWFLVVLALIMGGVTIKIFREKFPVFLYTTAVVSVCYLLFSFSRPDEIAAKYLIAQEKQLKEEDVYYLLRRPSLDGAEVLTQLDYERYSDRVKMDVFRYFSNISEKNKEMDIRSTNYMRSRTVKAANAFLEEHRDWKNLTEPYLDF